MPSRNTEALCRVETKAKTVVEAVEGASCDEFWQGALRLYQPRKGFRLGTATMLLAASIPSSEGGHGIDAGAGVGSLGIMVTHRLTHLSCLGIEIDNFAYQLAVRNVAHIKTMTMHHANFCDALPTNEKKPGDWLISNPPFYTPGTGRHAVSPAKATAHHGDQDLEAWMAACKAWLKPGKRAYFILPTSALQSFFRAASRLDFGAVSLRPVHSFADRPAKLVLLSARKNRQGAAQLEPPLVLYKSERVYSPEAELVLNHGFGITEALLAAKKN